MMTGMDTKLLGLRTAIYRVADLEKAKTWYSEVLGKPPYFDQPFYVGFDVGGYELGLLPDSNRAEKGIGGTMAYWGVDDADAAYRQLLEHGATAHNPVEDVGDGIKVGAVLDPFGNTFAVIENPHFKL
jgi:predicted enzyme related to lactoylglutathione lyase